MSDEAVDVTALLARAKRLATNDRKSINSVIAIIETEIDANPEGVAYFMKELPKLYQSRAKTVDQLMAIARLVDKVNRGETDGDDGIDGMIDDLDLNEEERKGEAI